MSLDTDAPPPGTDALVAGGAYKACAARSDAPALANDYRCAALVAEQVADPVSAALLTLSAAWACDDENADVAARGFRERAEALFAEAAGRGLRFGDDEGEVILRVELLRRAEAWERALALANDAANRFTSGPGAKVLAYERRLLAERDSTRHTVDEAFSGEQGTDGDA